MVAAYKTKNQINNKLIHETHSYNILGLKQAYHND